MEVYKVNDGRDGGNKEPKSVQPTATTEPACTASLRVHGKGFTAKHHHLGHCGSWGRPVQKCSLRAHGKGFVAQHHHLWRTERSRGAWGKCHAPPTAVGGQPKPGIHRSRRPDAETARLGSLRPSLDCWTTPASHPCLLRARSAPFAGRVLVGRALDDAGRWADAGLARVTIRGAAAVDGAARARVRAEWLSARRLVAGRAGQRMGASSGGTRVDCGVDGWERCAGEGVGDFGIPRGGSRRAQPRLAPRVRPHAARGPGARGGGRPSFSTAVPAHLLPQGARPVGGNEVNGTLAEKKPANPVCLVVGSRTKSAICAIPKMKITERQIQPSRRALDPRARAILSRT
eukprot:gene22409-biopygen4234